MVRGIEKFGYVYIMTNKNKTVLYIGVTNNLVRRIYEHKNHIFKNSFTDKYNCEYCIYYEEFAYFDLAIAREKELKKWNRQKKEVLINKKNSEWKELVTERGFVRDKQQIPHCVRNDDGNINTGDSSPSARNDGGVCDNKGGVDGGFAAVNSSPSFCSATVIPNGVKRNEESDDFA